MKRLTSGLLLLTVCFLFLPGCAALKEYSALQKVAWSFEGVSDVRVANIALTNTMEAYSDLGVTDLARFLQAVSRNELPLELVAHIGARNPASNSVSARLMDLGWTLFIEEKRTVRGRLGNSYTIPPGEAVDVPVVVQLDLFEFFEGSTQEVFDLVLAISGQGSKSIELRLELVPTIETSLGTMTYPSPLVVRRRVGR